MDNKLYVGNLSYSTRDDSLRRAFSEFGSVNSAKVMMERESDRSKGFGFVEMGSAQEAQAAIEGLNGRQVDGRALTVNIARPMEPRSGGSFRGGSNNRY
ncbi:RNA-binding protein [Xenophilus arseniciresistens]|uniref:RNA-binding protein n=1 Tax=Xenophilus arseniciresistens TaxID=1283306 RepID=A0AAE3N4D8_9BURK|nr:RNA-binding protein [Xenophilus arseniciresistens]MDA7415036.1 RNA-binding protein [Xenophilus arseniciresistens]